MGSEGDVPAKEQRGPWPARKRMRVLIIVSMVVLASVVTAASAVDRQERGVAFTVHTDKDEYAVGETIRMYAEYMNYGYDAVDMTFGSSLVAHFSVHDSDGSLVYAIPQVALWWMVYETLEPGESICGGCGWNQTDDSCASRCCPRVHTRSSRGARVGSSIPPRAPRSR